MEYLSNNIKAFQTARKKDFYKEITSHMKRPRIYTKEELFLIASKYTRRIDFKNSNENKGAYNAARKFGILDEICSHMDVLYINWDFKSIYKESKKYKTIIEFKRFNKNAYQAAVKLKIVDKVCSYMKRGKTGFIAS